MKVKTIRTRWVLDSRGDPTVEVDVILNNGALGRASAPAGVSIGQAEAHELRDNVKHFGGRGVSSALNTIEFLIKPALIDCQADNQESIDAKLIALDGSKDKHVLGSNATIAVSLAVAKAVASSYKVPLYKYIADLSSVNVTSLPVPLVDVINGGLHARGSLDIEEIAIIPVGARNIYTAIKMSTEIFHSLGLILTNSGFATGLGDEGGYAPWGMQTTKEALDSIIKAVMAAGYKPNEDIKIGLDVAASQLFHKSSYHFSQERKNHSTHGLGVWYDSIINKYPIISIEDPYDQEAWADWQFFTAQHPDMQILGDEFLATNVKRLRRAIRLKAANTLLVKPNQAGTLTETIHAAQIAKKAGWRVVVANRSGETEDTSIVHLAVGLGAGQIKIGAVARGEHTAKYNELLRIAESLKTDRLANVWS